MATVTLVGTGTIGHGWAVAFARAGCAVRLYDESAAQAVAAVEATRQRLDALPPSSAPPGSVCAHAMLDEALEGAAYVQESVSEDVAIKHRVFESLDRLTGPDVLLASSASTLLPDDFLDVPGRGRCLIAHPFNPTYLLPVVELVPSQWTTPDTLARAQAVLRAIGQVPVVVRKPVFGYIGNRLQAAVINEAVALIAEGVTTPAELDAVMTYGLGPRWALSGPFETMDLNAPGGIADYAGKYQSAYLALGATLARPSAWPDAALQTLVDARRAQVPLEALPERSVARDQALAALNATLDVTGFRTGGSSQPGGG